MCVEGLTKSFWGGGGEDTKSDFCASNEALISDHQTNTNKTLPFFFCFFFIKKNVFIPYRKHQRLQSRYNNDYMYISI